MISRDVVFDTSISDRARFLYVYMACKPESWDFYQDKVAEELGYTKDTLRKYLDELITRGWITEDEQRNSGQFGCLVYTIEIERCEGNLPIRKNTDTEKNRNGKNPNQRNIYNISEDKSSSINRNIENKRLSNDNPKCADDGLDFETSFYKLYPLKKAKQVAQRAWNKLSAKDKREAIDKLPAYIADCALNKRSFKHPATYLNQRTWEDDFGVRTKISFYDALETDSEEKKRFKSWMRKTHPEIENTALPLSYEDYMEFYKEYGTCSIDAALAYIEKDIYRYRKSDIASVLRTILQEEED